MSRPPPTAVCVTAPSRLHFGLLSFGRPDVRQFGGLGAMIASPGVRLTIQPASEFAVSGPLSERARACVERLAKVGWFAAPPACRIEVRAAPRAHVGLGSGTQMALATALGLAAFLGRPAQPIAELARSAGRGLRSAIGLHGFAQGGLLFEAGKLSSDEISPLVARVALPVDWRFVLLCPRQETGLYGEAERQAFDRLPPVPPATTDELCSLAALEMLPAAGSADFARFSDAIYRFGHLAGRCFAAQQSAGAFASQRMARIVDAVRRQQVTGVVQTSWGPTLAALLPSEAAAAEFAARFRAAGDSDDLDITIAAPDNQGARVEALHAEP
jgi:beta-ribofuranosylaminobenzene 5'-phosphate synthase